MDNILGDCMSYEKDPLAWVGYAFPWGVEGGPLEEFPDGPDEWQRRVLIHIRDKLASGATMNEAIQVAVASGHGVGKSALVSWIILWSISSMEDARGVVTANTETQLKTKTWAELGKWYHMFMGKEYFKLTATALFSADSDRERTWRIDMVPWSERSTEAFAGLHNKGRRVILLMDEASAIPDIIWETAEGALTDSDTQILWCVFGNPTRSLGRFRECFGRFKERWWHEQVDSRSVKITNKEQFARWIKDYGEDSDFVRVRVRGIFPRTGELEFISVSDVESAMLREPMSHLHEPLIIGVDVARYGTNESVIYFRKGRDAKTIEPKRFRGLSTVALAQEINKVYQQFRVDAIFIDGGGVGGGVVDNVRALHLFCYDIQFGGKPDGFGFAQGIDGEKYANKRAEMWGAMRAWLKTGAILDDPDLRAQLIGPTYTYNLRSEIQLEKKEDMMKRGLESPDLADGLALTFAMPVNTFAGASLGEFSKPLVESEYNPFAPERMIA